MNCEQTEVLIIGGGLSGIYAAWLLSRKNIPFFLLEARSRVGGRILCREYQGYVSDMGPSWFWPDVNPEIERLVRTLGLDCYQQFEKGYGCFQHEDGSVQTFRGYASMPASWRICGGMISLVTGLLKEIPRNAIRLDHPVCEIRKKASVIQVSVGELEKPPNARFRAKKVILALPPRLAGATMLFTPDLNFQLTQAMMGTATWMAGQAKFCALYQEPFWRESGLSGQAFSQIGPLGEIHDGSNRYAGPYGLTGFINIPAAQRSSEKNMTRTILSQFAAIFGPAADQPVAVYYQDWAREPYTATLYDQPPLREHPVYGPPAGITQIWDGMLHFAGSETADQHGGYLEGALSSAGRAVMAL